MDTADLLLEAYAKQVARRMGTNETTNTSQLEEYGMLNFRAGRFLGVFPADVTPERPEHRSFYVQNTLRSDSTDRSGHWTAIALEPDLSDLSDLA